MIPDFKTFIKESIWSDIQDRSMGKTVREEDKIITNEELKNKIYNLYKEQGKGETLDVSSLTNFICDDFSYLFKGFYKVKHIIGLEDWDVSNVKDMHNMFEGCENFNCDLSNWDVSNVEDMHSMFWDCKTFNSDLSKWNVSSVEDMSSMFADCINFNSDLSKWNVSSVGNMSSMFADCDKFNSDLSKWNVSSVGDMSGMFYNCENFNSDLNNWDVSSVKSMSGIFYNCKTFNSDLSNWDVSNVKYMNSMFADCDNFNSDLSYWNVSSVEYMGNMFKNCDNFNSDLSKWNVSSAGDMEGMFDGCKSLKQIPSWYMNRDLNESIWSDIQDRSMGKTVRKEDDINLLDTDEFIEYLKKSYNVCIYDPHNFFEIGGLYVGSHRCNISIPIEKNDNSETPNMSNRMLVIEVNLKPGGEILITPNMYVFRLYPREIQKTFGDKYIINTSTHTLTPKDKIINNSVIVDVIDKLLGMVENPILKKN